ncbi:MAG: cbb3-type cytochrome c oxidase N-terminal domain-containing protein [Vulcanimicrobiota bacterium]
MSAPILDHSCDGIEELDNPLPRWWLYLFYITIIFSMGYVVYYPSFWFWPGTSGWSQEKQWSETKIVKTAAAAVEVSLSALAAKPEVLDAGKKVFMSTCASCHGNNAEGKIGPCLTDSVWKYGDDDKTILETITKGRPGGMPAWGTFLKPDQVTSVAAYIHSIGNTTATPANATTATPAAAVTPAATATAAVNATATPPAETK